MTKHAFLDPDRAKGRNQMFRKFVIAVFTAVAAILETAADAIAATLPPPAADGPRLRLVASGRLWVPVTTAPRNYSSTNVTSKPAFYATLLHVSSRVLRLSLNRNWPAM
jgi:hypothetical protein